MLLPNDHPSMKALELSYKALATKEPFRDALLANNYPVEGSYPLLNFKHYISQAHKNNNWEEYFNLHKILHDVHKQAINIEEARRNRGEIPMGNIELNEDALNAHKAIYDNNELDWRPNEIIPEDYYKNYSEIIKYSSSTTKSILEGMQPEDWEPNSNSLRRLILADAVGDEGREEEANHIRNLSHHLHYDPESDKFEPGQVKFKDIIFSDDGETIDNLIDHLDQHGPESLIDNLITNYEDSGYHELRPEPAHGSRDFVHNKGPYILSVSRNYPYLGLQKRIIIPESKATATHINKNNYLTAPNRR